MRKVYNNFIDLSSNFKKFFKLVTNISKPQTNFIVNCLIGMIKAESIVTTDIIKKIPVDYFDESLFSSKVKKFFRFFNNSHFKPYDFYDSIIQHIISNFKCKNRNVYISFDHMFCKDRFTVFMISLKIGKQRFSIMVSLFFWNKRSRSI